MQHMGCHGVYIWLLYEVLWLGVVLAADGRPPFSIADANWRTDFSRHTVPLDEIRAGGPPRDGIPPLDTPRFVPLATANAWLHGREPVVAVHRHGVAKAYPLQILIWHEIVNDTIGHEPIAVTFCPLCNSAVAFQRQLDGQALGLAPLGGCGTAIW